MSEISKKEIAKKNTEFSTTANDVMRFADQIKNAGEFIPQQFKGNAGAIAAAILTGRELGLEPMASLRSLYVVRGKVGISYDAMVGLLRAHGYGVEWLETTNEVATIRLTHKDKTLKPMVMSYTKQDSITAELWGSGVGWKKHPATMLRARCVSNAARAFAGEILAGIYTVDEIDEIKEREEKLIDKVRVSSGVASLEARMLIDNEKEKPETEEKTEKPNLKDESVVSDITEFDLILDEIESACRDEDLSICKDKISKSEQISEEDKDKLRIAYKDKQKEFKNEKII